MFTVEVKNVDCIWYCSFFNTTKDVDGETDASLIDNWIKSGGSKNDTLIPKSGLKPDDDTSQKPDKDTIKDETTATDHAPDDFK